MKKVFPVFLLRITISSGSVSPRPKRCACVCSSASSPKVSKAWPEVRLTKGRKTWIRWWGWRRLWWGSSCGPWPSSVATATWCPSYGPARPATPLEWRPCFCSPTTCRWEVAELFEHSSSRSKHLTGLRDDGRLVSVILCLDFCKPFVRDVLLGDKRVHMSAPSAGNPRTGW